MVNVSMFERLMFFVKKIIATNTVETTHGVETTHALSLQYGDN